MANQYLALSKSSPAFQTRLQADGKLIGIILLSSLLIAAGVAAYESPEIRAWVEERRRKIAVTLNDIANELDSQRMERRRRFGNEDVSTREDDSAEAVQRRRRARQEIMERGLMMEQRRKPTHNRRNTASSFDDMVDSTGKLIGKDVQNMATSVEGPSMEANLRNRRNHTQGIAVGSAIANPFDDELGGVIDEKAGMEDELNIQRERSLTFVPENPLHIDTRSEVVSVSESAEDVVNLTPTTSLAASTLLSDSGIMTPTSTQHPLSNQQEPPTSQTNQAPTTSYQSIQEWASSAASSGPASFYSSPGSERHIQPLDSAINRISTRVSSTTASIIGTNDITSQAGDLGVDVLSDVGIDTPSSWSEIGSQVSED